MSDVLQQVRQRLDEGPGEPVERIFSLLQEGLLAAEVFHHFACDCAERALQREQDAGRAVDEACWQAIEARRRCLAGELEEEALQAYVSLARSAAHGNSISGRGYEAATAAADAASDIAYAARAAAWSLTAAAHAAPPQREAQARLDESQWQLQRFLQLVEEHAS